eukprot:SAG11_NODE_1738_length_4341_cov_3.274806_5_plen_102_part_00
MPLTTAVRNARAFRFQRWQVGLKCTSANFGLHASHAHAKLVTGLSWPDSTIVYPGSSGYSDLAFTQDSIGIGALFESDGYNHITFKSVPLPIGTSIGMLSE